MRKYRELGAGPGGMDARSFADWYRKEIAAQWRSLDLMAIARIARLVERACSEGRRIFIMGNGGSAATASHMATDLSKTAHVPGRPQLRCLSLTDNVPFITAIGNDLGYDQIFVRQMENLLEKGDVVILVSGSGNSANVVEATRYAKSRGATTVGLLGFDGGALKPLVDVALVVNSDQYGVIEDLHMGIGHILTFYLKQKG